MQDRSRPCCTSCPCSSLPITPPSRAVPTSTSRAIWPSRSPWNNLRLGQNQDEDRANRQHSYCARRAHPSPGANPDRDPLEAFDGRRTPPKCERASLDVPCKPESTPKLSTLQ